MQVFAEKEKPNSCIGTASGHLPQHCLWLLLCHGGKTGQCARDCMTAKPEVLLSGFYRKNICLPLIYDKVNLLFHCVLSQLITLSVPFYSVLKDKTSVWERWVPVYFAPHLDTSWRSSAQWVSPYPCLILNFNWWSASDGAHSSKSARCCSSLLVISRDFKIPLGNFFFFL